MLLIYVIELMPNWTSLLWQLTCRCYFILSFFYIKKYLYLILMSCVGKGNSVQFSRSVVSDSLWPHELQHTRPPCLPPTPPPYPCSWQDHFSYHCCFILGVLRLEFRIVYFVFWASQVALVVKNPPASEGDIRDVGSISGSGRSPGGGHSNPL